ncbi:MAG TPA: DUF1778 domain-containing protein [Stellaceae bacterium]|nr:DUF1778 domain-containing protein [Stellaceae bacterium]
MLEKPMLRSQSVKRERMHLRLDARTKQTLERAAHYEEKSLSDFVLATAKAAAQRVIERHETVTLSAEDWDVFFETLVHPPEPNAILKAAVRRFRGHRRA